MIVVRTPFRMSFCGGGSDMPSFYEKHGGCVLSTSIDKYVYLSIHPSFDRESILLKYSSTEKVSDYEKIRHPIFKECLSHYNITGVDINSIADIPAGTGMGSSSSFTVALVTLLREYMGMKYTKGEVAIEACDVEINRLKEPIGKQDQYAAAYGGLNFYEFNKNGSVNVCPLNLKKDDVKKLDQDLLLLYLGGVRSASSILSKQNEKSKSGSSDGQMMKMCNLARELKERLENGDIDSMGEILDRGWNIKKTFAPGISNEYIDSVYEKALGAGATGGKLLGAGGNGFMLFHAPKEKHKQITDSLSELRTLPFEFENNGVTVLYKDTRAHYTEQKRGI